MINGLLYLINLLKSPNNTQGKREMVSFFILRHKQTWTKETPPLCFCDQIILFVEQPKQRCWIPMHLHVTSKSAKHLIQ